MKICHLNNPFQKFFTSVFNYNLKVVNKVGKSWSKLPYNPVARRRREECIFVVDKEKVRLALVE